MDLISVVESEEFARRSARLMSESEKVALIGFLALRPEAGDVVPGAGGIRKLRWGAEGRGKRGGVRVIYYFHNRQIPLTLLDVFAKNQKTDLTELEKQAFRRLIPWLVKSYGPGGRNEN